MIYRLITLKGLCRYCIDPVINRGYSSFITNVPSTLKLNEKVGSGSLTCSHNFKMFDQFSCLNAPDNPDGVGSDSRHESPSPTADEEAECFFASSSSARRRFSTIDDEAKVIGLMKEILALRDTNVSNWIIESKVKTLCKVYMFLLPPHREGFLKVLATEFAVDSQAVSSIARNLVQREQEATDPESSGLEQRQIIKIQERLRNALTPQYSWLFSHVGRLENGVKFLVDLRTDVLDLAGKLESTDPAQASVQQLNITMRNLLSMWFSVGFLKLERVTWNSSCQMLQKISTYEAVHPVRSWTDLKRRVGLYRRCFVYTHSSMPDEPLVVLHTALCDDIASNMASIVTAPKRMAENMEQISGADVLPGLKPDTEDPQRVKAAIFYSISSTQKGLQGIELGNYLIKRVVQELQTEFPMVNKFSTLSPIPGFHAWLSDKLKAVERGENEVLTPEEEFRVQDLLAQEDWSRELRRLLKNNFWLENDELMSFLQRPLMRLCARYLFLEKRRSAALDSVANFHLKNGAVMWRINWRADVSPRGVGSSCGMMVNYRYILEDTELNSRNYLEKNTICASGEVKRLAAEAEQLKSSQILSKM